jgi:hypothetical protein
MLVIFGCRVVLRLLGLEETVAGSALLLLLVSLACFGLSFLTARLAIRLFARAGWPSLLPLIETAARPVLLPEPESVETDKPRLAPAPALASA